MEKTRVDLYKRYYFLYFSRLDGRVQVAVRHDTRNSEDYARFKSGNYYASEKKAHSLARKINAVLEGADAIETPESNEVDMIQREIGLEVGGEDEELVEAASLGAIRMINWLIDKIVK